MMIIIILIIIYLLKFNLTFKPTFVLFFFKKKCISVFARKKHILIGYQILFYCSLDQDLTLNTIMFLRDPSNLFCM